MSSGDFVPLRKQQHQQQQSHNVSSSSQNAHIAKSTSADAVRSRHGIEVEDSIGQIPDPITTFDEITNLPHHLKTFLKRTKRLVKPTPVQMQGIGCLEASRDVICLSATGTGKTLAYLLPMCSFLWKHKNEILHMQQEQQQHHHQQQYQNHQHHQRKQQQQYPQQQNKGQQDEVCCPLCLIIVPTRELMHQVLENTKELVNALGPLTFEQVGNTSNGGDQWPGIGHNGINYYGSNQGGQFHPNQQQFQQFRMRGSQQQQLLPKNSQFQSTGI